MRGRFYSPPRSPAKWSRREKRFTLPPKRLFSPLPTVCATSYATRGYLSLRFNPAQRTPTSFIGPEWTTTEVGSKGKSESQPDDVARQGIDALLAGDDHVYAASMKTKLEGKLANVVPGAMKGAMHEKMAKPLEEEKAAR